MFYLELISVLIAAHSCQHCDRRFSVASNLRRHLRSCQASKHRSPEAPTAESPTTSTSTPSNQSGANSTSMHGHRTTPYARSNATSSNGTAAPKAPRKPRAPVNRWLPQSLASLSNAASLTSTPPFNFPPLTVVSLPLPPVTPHRLVGSPQSSLDDGSIGEGDDADSPHWEERDSYDAYPPQPYHPTQWKNKLPGPALLPADELVKNATVARRWILQT